jgi:hypothetical protein
MRLANLTPVVDGQEESAKEAAHTLPGQLSKDVRNTVSFLDPPHRLTTPHLAQEDQCMAGIAVGTRVRILTGKYAGICGIVIDPALGADMLPAPRQGYYWVRIHLHSHSVPVHVHEDDVHAEPAS